MRDALGPDGRVRIDANGGWSVDEAVAAIGVLDRAAGGLEYVEQPCATVEDLAAVRRAVDVPIAADESIRRAADPYRVRDLEAADIAVLKVQPLGGVRACLRIAEDIGLPVVVSSALETSVGIAAGVALAAALPELPYACGLATVQLLTDDVVADPLLPVDGALPVVARRSTRRRSTGWPPRPERVAALGGPAGRGPGRAAGSRLVTNPVDRAGPRGGHGAGRQAGVTEVVLAPGLAERAAGVRGYDAAEAGLLRLHTRIDERTAGFLALGLTKVGAPAAVMCTSGTAVANLHPAVLEAAHAGVPLVVVTADRPARLRGTGANQTTDQVGIFGRRWSPTVDVAAPADAPRPRRLAPDGPCTSTSSSTTRWSPTTGGQPGRRPRSGPTRGERRRRPRSADAPRGRPAHRRGRRRRRRPARPGARRGRRLAAAGRAEQRLAHRARTRSAATGCCSTATLGQPDRAGVVFGHPTLSRPVHAAARPRRRRGLAPGRRGASGPERPFPVAATFDAARASDGPDDPGWLDGVARPPTRDVGRRLDALLAAEGTTPYGVAGRGQPSAARARGCWSSAPPARSATST